MIDFKQKIAEQISKTTNIPQEQIIEYIEIPADEKMGDFSFPCFKLAKELKKAPQMIAQEIKDNIEWSENLSTQNVILKMKKMNIWQLYIL